MFFQDQSEEIKSSYVAYLRGIASLSKLFSDSKSPYISYRVSENLFCMAFDAVNVSRTDCSADATKRLSEDMNLGFGIKTFLEKNNKSLEKVAEFNKDLSEEVKKSMNPEQLVKYVGKLRNRRIESTCDILELDKIIYHCVVRSKGRVKIYEQEMSPIDLDNITFEGRERRHIHFNDGLNEYELNLSKSTLFKRFSSIGRVTSEFDIQILENPFELIRSLGVGGVLIETPGILQPELPVAEESVCLPLFSPRSVENPRVFERSGLNQWNAGGRARHADELYIPIPIWIHSVFPNFFPPQDTHFDLILPNRRTLVAKVCQQGGKALMSAPNQALGHWILRDILHIPEGELVTYEDLRQIGIDSVEITKIGDLSFEINFKKIGTYAEFEKDYL